MKKKRLIPVLLLKNGWLVQSKEFKRHQNLGNPIWAVKRLSEWASDEMIYLDISKDDQYDMRRDDLAGPNRQTFLEIIQDVAKMSFMPIAVGGKIRTLEDIRTRLFLGADKVVVNTQPLLDRSFIGAAAREFGSQCIVLSVDVKKTAQGYRVMSHGATKETSYEPAEWTKIAENEGAGEILLNSVDRDGMRTGYDLGLLEEVASKARIPVIACGGAGEWEHFSEAFEKTSVDAVAAANIFHYVDQSVYLAKKFLYERRCPVRPADLLTV